MAVVLRLGNIHSALCSRCAGSDADSAAKDKITRPVVIICTVHEFFCAAGAGSDADSVAEDEIMRILVIMRNFLPGALSQRF